MRIVVTILGIAALCFLSGLNVKQITGGEACAGSDYRQVTCKTTAGNDSPWWCGTYYEVYSQATPYLRDTPGSAQNHCTWSGCRNVVGVLTYDYNIENCIEEIVTDGGVVSPLPPNP